jgi:5-methylthioadenosine/S-adenosylhomocysteine deaminase
LHLDTQIVSLEVGKRADVVVLEMDAIDQVHLSSIYSALVCATRANDVCDLIVEGRVLMRHRQLTTIDEAEVRNDGLALRHQILERLQKAA